MLGRNGWLLGVRSAYIGLTGQRVKPYSDSCSDLPGGDDTGVGAIGAALGDILPGSMGVKAVVTLPPAFDTGGCTFAKIFATPGWRITLICYSHQYDNR